MDHPASSGGVGIGVNHTASVQLMGTVHVLLGRRWLGYHCVLLFGVP